MDYGVGAGIGSMMGGMSMLIGGGMWVYGGLGSMDWWVGYDAM